MIQKTEISSAALVLDEIPTVDDPKPINDAVTDDIEPDVSSITSNEKKLLLQAAIDEDDQIDEQQSVQDLQDELEERFFTQTPQTDHSKTDEICTSQVDSSAIEDLPLRREDRKKSFLATANVRTKVMQEKLRNQAGVLKTKLKGLKKPKSESPKAKERKKFRKPEFAKLKNIQMPKIQKPDFKMPELKRPEFKRPEFKRPEFTKFKTPEFKKPDFKINLPDRPKFSKPDISKFKIPERFTSLRRSKSLKEERPTSNTSESGETGTTATEDRPPQATTKKFFDFGTYPRIFDRMRKQSKPEASISRDDEQEEDEESDRHITPVQFGTFPKMGKKRTSTPPPTGDTSSRWSSNVSYADNDSGQYQRYSSEPDGFERETSIERRMRANMKDSLDEDEDIELGATNAVQTEEQRQLAEYDAENRVIHEISKAREDEFRQRKPLVHQESDLASEDISTKDFGWIENDSLRKRIQARSTEFETRKEYIGANDSLPDRDRASTQETQSSGSSSTRRRKGVIEEIDDDEFYLRKKGISQDDIQLGQYISSAIRDGLDTPANALAQLGQYDNEYFEGDFDMSNENVRYSYDVPPRKPRRIKDYERNLELEDDIEDEDSRLSYDDDFVRDNNYYKTFPPNRPLRKTKKQFSEDSQVDEEHEVPVAAEYYPHPDEEDDRSFYEHEHLEELEPNEGILSRDYADETNVDNLFAQQPPVAPRRKKKLQRESVERDLAANQLLDRSVSNNFISNGNVEDVRRPMQRKYKQF